MPLICPCYCKWGRRPIINLQRLQLHLTKKRLESRFAIVAVGPTQSPQDVGFFPGANIQVLFIELSGPLFGCGYAALMG